MQASGAELASIQAGIRNLSIGQESLTRRADEQEAALDQMKREFKQLERELQEFKSAPPARNVSPVQTPRSGYARSDSPRFSGQREVDELQIVIGGWSEAKRDAIEGDVRNMFETLRAGALLKAVYVPYVRSGFCRVELVYAEQDLWARRKLQTTVLKHLQGLGYKSCIPGQESSRFWFTRNRAPQERAKIRAILSVQELCVKHIGESLVDRDWRGKLWANGQQLLNHVEYAQRAHHTLMLTDAKGNETGWFLDVTKTAGVLGVPESTVLQHFGAE